jgi:hypothetical protein
VITPTDYFHDFVHYMKKAAALQDMNLGTETGRDVHTQQVGDPLMDYVTIYDVVERRYAGFSNAPQQLWCGSKNPKRWQARPEFDKLQAQWPISTWLLIFLLHRITGSGASFAHDHGFRNSILPELGERCQTMDEVITYWLEAQRAGRPLFTSIGNQPPQFGAAPTHWKPSGWYVHQHAPRVVQQMLDHFDAASQPLGVRAAVDLANEYNLAHGLKRFSFVYTAWIMDIAEYFPQWVEPRSHCYYGKNADEAFGLLFDRPRGMRQDQFDEAAMEAVGEEFRRLRPDLTDYPMSLEDVACDYIRYIECYVPKGYEHLPPEAVTNRSLVQHPVRHPSYHKHLAQHGIASQWGVAT